MAWCCFDCPDNSSRAAIVFLEEEHNVFISCLFHLTSNSKSTNWALRFEIAFLD